MLIRRPRKILVHDYSGHAFTSQLARELARRGNTVVYMSFSEFGTPKGRVNTEDTDPPNFRAQEISINSAFDKDNLFKRHQQQLQYAVPAAALIEQEQPDYVLSANSPPEVQARLQRAARKVGARFVFWIQDINSEAIGRILGRKNPLLGKLAGTYYRNMERRMLRDSAHVVAIADDFVDVVGGWGVPRERLSVIENWAPLDEIPQLDRDNDWAEANYRPGRTRVVYSGTLARKHDPEILVRLAQELDVDVYLFSAGSGAEHVKARKDELHLDNLFVRSWVSMADFPKMLAGADVLCAFIEKDAGVFSVPSKVLSYLAAGRPILAAISGENLAARTIKRAEAGLVCEPGDHPSMLANAARLVGDPELRRTMGRNGRAYAEKSFDVSHIAARFEGVLVGDGTVAELQPQ